MLPGLSSYDGFVEMSPALVDGCVIFKHCQNSGMGQLEGAGTESPNVSGQEQSKKPNQQPYQLNCSVG